MADDRTYIKLHDGFDENRKVAGLTDKAFRTYVEALCYCSRNLTDGLIPLATSKKLATPRVWTALVEVGLMEPTSDGYAVHDYLEHQRSAEQVKQLKEARREAGKRGGKAKASALANAKQEPSNVPSKTPSQSYPETESLTNVRDQAETDPSLRSGRAPKRATQIPDDFEVTENMRVWATANRIGPNLERETAKFRDHHIAKGSTFKNWEAAWHTWMRKADEYANVRQLPLTASGKEYQPWNP